MASTLELFDTPEIPGVLKEIKRVLKPNGRLSIGSLSRENREESLFVKIYEWLHLKVPKFANCRPIYVEKSVREAGYKVTSSEEFVLYNLVAWRIVVASPEVAS